MTVSVNPHPLHSLISFANTPLDITVNGQRALRLEPQIPNINVSDAPNVIGGSESNTAAFGIFGATIGGGGASSYLTGPAPNRVLRSWGTVGGGLNNTAGGDGATVAGGFHNTASGEYSTIAGGEQNTIQGTTVTIWATASTIGGGSSNGIADNSGGSTIAGGYNNDIGTNSAFAAIGGGYQNRIQSGAHLSTISGGAGNVIHSNASFATISGGDSNTIETEGDNCTIGGGTDNWIQSDVTCSTIGGGLDNTIEPGASYSSIGGGSDNTIEPSASYSIIGGGREHTIQTNAQFATIPGGWDNRAASYAFAAGTRAKANHAGAFVWGDSTNADIASTNANSVTFRSAGGVRLFSDGSATTGVFLAPGAGAWTAMSDRHAKENFHSVDSEDVLERVARLPVQTWNYKSQDAAVRHLGPMAQDFKAAFGLGESDTGITTVDADGVALAAIQGLNQKFEEETQSLREELKARDSEIQALKEAVGQLKELISARAKSNP